MENTSQNGNEIRWIPQVLGFGIIGIVLVLLLLSLIYVLYTKIKGESSSTLVAQETTQMEKESQTPKRIRNSVLAGTWYPANPQELNKDIKLFIDKASHNVKARLGRILAILCPHAGYVYSGETAAYGYRLILGRDIKRVIIMGPNHYMPCHGIALPDATHFETPLGLVPLDVEMIENLVKKDKLFQKNPKAHEKEHCLEIQLPFLQYVLKDFKIVPILVGSLETEDYKKAADVLRTCLDERTLILVSSDFTHYGYRFDYIPFTENVPESLRKLDMGAVDKITKMDLQGFISYCGETQATICGRSPISVLIAMLQGMDVTPELLQYTTSGANTGDYSNSVSYVCMSFTQKPPEIVNKKEQEFLLRLARESIKLTFEGKEPQVDPKDLDENLKADKSCFVTLTKNGDLRGCIGSLSPTQPLYLEVIQKARFAAFKDHRFHPLKKEELEQIHIEISVLSIPKSIPDYSYFMPGEHGVILKKGWGQAVFLPQVAPEQGWDRQTTLSYLSNKAGLPEDAWKEGATFEIFTVQAFEE